MNQFQKHIVFFLFFACFATTLIAQTSPENKDSVLVAKDTLELKYNFNHLRTGKMLLNYPSKIEVIYDKVLDTYVFVEKVGDYYIKTPIYMTPKEYEKYRLRRYVGVL